MNIIIGVQISNEFFDACLVDGYETTTELIHALKNNFNDETQVIDLFNYLDSDGKGTRNPTKLELIPNIDFSKSDGKQFNVRDLEDFKMQIDYFNAKVLIWKNKSWWIYNKFNKSWRKIK